MHILCLDCTLAPAFTALGHTVTSLALPAGTTTYEALAASLPQKPDCLIQQEKLTSDGYALVSGLEKASCPTLYLAMNAHRNLYWQQHYSRLFDAVLTPQRSLFDALPVENRHPHPVLFPHTGTIHPWIPHAKRKHALAFSGSLNENHPARTWMVQSLGKHFELFHAKELSFEDTLDLYSATRIVPNEAFRFAANSHLLEAASCGPALITPECGPDQDAVFERGKEMLVYRNGAELHEHVARLLRNPEEAEAMGRAAWERIQKEHLPEHRATAVITMLPSLTQTRLTCSEAATAFWQTKTEFLRNGYTLFPSEELVRESKSLPQTPQVLGGTLHLLGSIEHRSVALQHCQTLLDEKTGISSQECNATASACALRHGDFGMARQFWSRNNAAALPAQPAPAIPQTPFALCLAWAEVMHGLCRDVRHGFAFLPESGHLPACAHDFYTLAEFYDGKNIIVPERMAALLAAYPAYSVFRLGLLSRLAANEVSNWQTHLACGLAAIDVCHEDTAEQELVLAALEAESKGESPAFFRSLVTAPSGTYMEEVVTRLAHNARENASSKSPAEPI